METVNIQSLHLLVLSICSLCYSGTHIYLFKPEAKVMHNLNAVRGPHSTSCLRCWSAVDPRHCSFPLLESREEMGFQSPGAEAYLLAPQSLVWALLKCIQGNFKKPTVRFTNLVPLIPRYLALAFPWVSSLADRPVLLPQSS